MGLPKPTEAEDAYYVWATQADKSVRGSLARVSQLTGIPLHRIRYWHRAYGWDKRWVDETHAIRKNIYRESEAVMLANMRPMMERLGKVARDGSDRDAVQAIKVFAGIMGLDSGGGSQVNIMLNAPDKQLVADMKELGKAEMKALIAGQAQTNLEATANQRLNRKIVKSGGF